MGAVVSNNGGLSMLDAFFYGDWEPDIEGLQDEMRKVVVAAETCRLDTEIARKMLDGLVAQWEAQMDHKEVEPHLYSTFTAAEAGWTNAFTRAYRIQMRRNGFPVQNVDGIGWWPECMSQRDHWPSALVLLLADTAAGYEADVTAAAYREYQRRTGMLADWSE